MKRDVIVTGRKKQRVHVLAVNTALRTEEWWTLLCDRGGQKLKPAVKTIAGAWLVTSSCAVDV